VISIALVSLFPIAYARPPPKPPLMAKAGVYWVGQEYRSGDAVGVWAELTVVDVYLRDADSEPFSAFQAWVAVDNERLGSTKFVRDHLQVGWMVVDEWDVGDWGAAGYYVEPIGCELTDLQPNTPYVCVERFSSSRYEFLVWGVDYPLQIGQEFNARIVFDSEQQAWVAQVRSPPWPNGSQWKTLVNRILPYAEAPYTQVFGEIRIGELPSPPAPKRSNDPVWVNGATFQWARLAFNPQAPSWQTWTSVFDTRTFEEMVPTTWHDWWVHYYATYWFPYPPPGQPGEYFYWTLYSEWIAP
jgi:hypothetical protein